MDRLLGDTQAAGDVLPGPAELARVLHLKQFQPFGQCTQRGGRTQPDLRVLTRGTLGDLKSRFHACQHMLTKTPASTCADDRSLPGPHGAATMGAGLAPRRAGLVACGGADTALARVAGPEDRFRGLG